MELAGSPSVPRLTRACAISGGSDTFNSPASLNLPIEASPAAAIQPHSEHSGRPPIWQGTTGVDRSAEAQLVVCANVHSDGESGG